MATVTNRLKETEKNGVKMYYYPPADAYLTTAEIAPKLGLTEGGFKSRLNRYRNGAIDFDRLFANSGAYVGTAMGSAQRTVSTEEVSDTSLDKLEPVVTDGNHYRSFGTPRTAHFKAEVARYQNMLKEAQTQLAILTNSTEFAAVTTEQLEEVVFSYVQRITNKTLVNSVKGYRPAIVWVDTKTTETASLVELFLAQQERERNGLAAAQEASADV